MPNFKEEQFIQALAHIARVGDWTLAKVSRSDDSQKKTLTITFSGVSSGFVQDSLPYDDETTPLIAHANGRGEVEHIEGLQPGDLAETEADAKAEIAAAAGQIEGITPEPVEVVAGETPEASVIDPDDQPRDPEQPLVGELAAAAKRRR